MPQSLSLVLVHLVFSTKDRVALIGPGVRASLHAYIAEVARNMDCLCLRVGGTADHVHVMLSLARTVSISDVVQRLKTTSSLWMKDRAPEFRVFSWQRGYGAFSVGPGDQEALLKYIDEQEEHHKGRTFQDEYRAFLKKYNMKYEERYVWD